MRAMGGAPNPPQLQGRRPCQQRRRERVQFRCLSAHRQEPVCANEAGARYLNRIAAKPGFNSTSFCCRKRGAQLNEALRLSRRGLCHGGAQFVVNQVLVRQ